MPLLIFWVDLIGISYEWVINRNIVILCRICIYEFISERRSA